MKTETFEKIQAAAEEDLKLPDNLKDMIIKNEMVPTIKHKWAKLYSRQRYEVEKLKTDIQVMYGEKLKYYKFNDQYAWSTTKEIESQINCDKDYVALMREYNTQKYFLDYIVETNENMKSLDFVIKNYIEYKKIETTNF